MTRLVTNHKERTTQFDILEAGVKDNKNSLDTILEGSGVDLDQFSEVASGLATKAPIDNPTFTTCVTVPKIEVQGDGTIQGRDIVGNNSLRLRTIGGVDVEVSEHLNLAAGKTYKIGGSLLAAGNVGAVSTQGDTMTGNLIMSNNDTAKGIRFRENEANGNNRVQVKAAASLGGDYDVVLPSASGTLALTSEIGTSYPGSADATELNILDGATITTAQLNRCDATSSIQTQLDAKISYSSGASTQVATNVTNIATNATNIISNDGDITSINNTATTLRDEYDAEKLATAGYRLIIQNDVDANETAASDYRLAIQNDVNANEVAMDLMDDSIIATATTLRNEYDAEKIATASARGTITTAVDLNTSKYTTTQADAAITTAINNLVDGAPAAMNSLNELAAALGDDANYAASTAASLGARYTKTEADVLNTTQNAAIALNTAKTTYDAQVAVAANTAKISYSSGASTQVAANVSAIALKQDKLDGTHLHLHSNGTFVGIGTEPDYHLHIKDSGDPSVKIERASNNFVMLNETHMMVVKPLNAQFDFNLQGNTNDMVFKTNNLERIRLTAGGITEISGDVNIAAGKSYKINGTALAKGDVGLGNVDNTTDLLKVISTAQATANTAHTNSIALKVALAGDKTITGEVTISDDLILSSGFKTNSNCQMNNSRKLKFKESSGSGSNYIALQAPSSVGTSIDFVLPNADGDADQVLKTDGNSNLGWATAGGGASIMIIGGEVDTDNASPKRPLLVLGGKYLFLESSSSYCQIPEYNTVDVGWWCQIINGMGYTCYVQTYTRATTYPSNTNSTDQRLRSQRITYGSTASTKNVGAGLNGFVYLYSRTGGMEDWVVTAGS